MAGQASDLNRLMAKASTRSCTAIIGLVGAAGRVLAAAPGGTASRPGASMRSMRAPDWPSPPCLSLIRAPRTSSAASPAAPDPAAKLTGRHLRPHDGDGDGDGDSHGHGDAHHHACMHICAQCNLYGRPRPCFMCLTFLSLHFLERSKHFCPACVLEAPNRCKVKIRMVGDLIMAHLKGSGLRPTSI